jgi:hypothetical protein
VTDKPNNVIQFHKREPGPGFAEFDPVELGRLADIGTTAICAVEGDGEKVIQSLTIALGWMILLGSENDADFAEALTGDMIDRLKRYVRDEGARQAASEVKLPRFDREKGSHP